MFYCVAKRILKALQSVKNGFAPPFSLCFSKSRAARQSPFCKAVARPFQSRRKALPKSTKTGRKSVGFLILTQAPKCTRSHCFPPQKHPKNGFMMRFAGKNSFFQLRARDFSFYMNAYSYTVTAVSAYFYKHEINHEEVAPCCQTRTPRTPIFSLLLIC